jgi:uncharacterized protein YceH (UPF0502 family)
MQLTSEEARVLGSLVEKELTTPQQYPLTLVALTAACNQSSNREPVVSYDESTVLDALTSLKQQRFVRFVHPSHGRSVVRYRHILDESLDLEVPLRALFATLLLRGPQTVGELRIRSERMAEFSDLREVELTLEKLANMTEPLLTRIPKRPGQKDDRFVDTVVAGPRDFSNRDSLRHQGNPDGDDEDSPFAPSFDRSPVGGVRGADFGEMATQLELLAKEVSDLMREVGSLRRDLDQLRQSLGE